MKQLELLILGKPPRNQCATKRLENVRDEVAYEKDQRPVNQGRECDLWSLEEPANGRARKSKLPRMLCKIACIALVGLPKLRGLHRDSRPVPRSRVPGMPVGVLGVGRGCGVGVCGFAGILFLANVRCAPTGAVVR